MHDIHIYGMLYLTHINFSILRHNDEKPLNEQNLHFIEIHLKDACSASFI